MEKNKKKKFLFVTDVWDPHICGVVTIIKNIKRELEKQGFKVKVIHPGLFKNVSLPNYKEIKVPLFVREEVGTIIKEFNPNYIHLFTESVLGLAAKRVCRRLGLKYTTSFHTRFPEYINIRTKIPVSVTYSFLRKFHKESYRVLVSTDSLKKELERRNFKNLRVWRFGVDTDLFREKKWEEIRKTDLVERVSVLEKPIFVYMGRLTKEKSVEDFLALKIKKGSKLVIGGGPLGKTLKRKYRDKNVIFTGYKRGEELVDLLSLSDYFVFPSQTDTFGLVLVEALRCNLPILAYRVQGPRDIVKEGVTGVLVENNLEEGLEDLLKIKPEKDFFAETKKMSLIESAQNFLKYHYNNRGFS